MLLIPLSVIALLFLSIGFGSIWVFVTIFLIIGYYFDLVDKFIQLIFRPKFKEKLEKIRSNGNLMLIVKEIIHQLKSVPQSRQSFWLMVVYHPLALYLLTSSGSHIGMALIIGLGLHYCVEIMKVVVSAGSLKAKFFAHLEVKFSELELEKIAYVFVGLFVIEFAIFLLSF